MEPETPAPAAVRHVEFKAALLLALTAALITVFLGYVLYARGVFENTQRLVLITDDSEGVSVGSNLTFSGFPIGRVIRIELDRSGKARIEIDVPASDARWLRATSVFTLERGLVGPARLRAFTGHLDAEPLADGAMRQVLRGDATEGLPALIASTTALLQNLERVTAPDSNLNATLASVRGITGRMGGRYGVLGGLLGDDESAKKVIDAIDRANALLSGLEKASRKLEGTLDAAGRAIGKTDAMIGRADARLLGAGGLMVEAQKTLVQLNRALADARTSLKKVDAVISDVQQISTQASVATKDLDALRAEVEASLHKVSALIAEINRKWPFARDTELKLP